MKPLITDNDTLLLGCWIEDGRAAIVGALRTTGSQETTPIDDDIADVCRMAGAIVQDVIERCGAPWPALAAALGDAETIGCRGWVILCNDKAMVQALRTKKAPAPTESKRQWIGKDTYLEGKYGGDADHWEALRRLGMHGRWTVVQSDKLQKARELWLQG